MKDYWNIEKDIATKGTAILLEDLENNLLKLQFIKFCNRPSWKYIGFEKEGKEN